MKSGLISMYVLLKEARMYILCPSYYTYGTYNRKDTVLLQKWIYFLNRKPIRHCNENIILMYSFIKIGELIWNHKWFDEKRANQIIINLYICNVRWTNCFWNKMRETILLSGICGEFFPVATQGSLCIVAIHSAII